MLLQLKLQKIHYPLNFRLNNWRPCLNLLEWNLLFTGPLLYCTGINPQLRLLAIKMFNRGCETVAGGRMGSNTIFTITAEIHARSLAKFYGQYAVRHMNLKFVRRVSERERAGNSTICYRKKQIDVSFQCVCSVIDNVMTKFMINDRTDA